MTVSDLQPLALRLPRAGARHATRDAGRVLLAAAVVVNAAVLVVGTTVAAFTGQATVPQTSSSGKVSITLTEQGTAKVSTGVAGLAAGDWFERLVDLSPGTDLAVGSWTLSTAATTSSVLDTTAGNGLRVKVDHCTVPWTEVVTVGVYSYTCSGTQTAALAERDIVMSALPLSGLGTGTNHLRLTVKLAATAPDTLQSRSSTIAYTFAGVQRAGQAR